MNFQPAGPGKTAPKLYQDFLAFDPIRGRPNVLTDHTPPSGEGPQLAAPLGSCKHEYTPKFSQSVPPPLDLRPDGTTTYKLAVVCQKCRIHADIRIDHSNSKNPCPTSDHPLHHFVRVPGYDSIGNDRIRYAWHCSILECQATLLISFYRPRLGIDEIKKFIDPDQLKGRYEALMKEEPSREGVRQATPMEALSRLRRYIKDSLNPEHEKRQLSGQNKRFQETFGVDGQDCYDLLDRLGFKYAEGNWTLPSPSPNSDPLRTDGTSHAELLQDVEMELLAYMCTMASEQGVMNPAAGEGWSSANRDIERTLAAQGFQRHVTQRRSAVSNTDIPFYNSLGTLPEFADSLIEYAYDRQAETDKKQRPYYFECLQQITDARGTEGLHVKVAVLTSSGLMSRRDISAAYRYLNIPPSEANYIDDSRIIDLFQAQQADLGQQAQEEARLHLYRLGVARKSDRLINASRQSLDTYEDALDWLGNGADKATSDEGILAIVAVKDGESESSAALAKKAVTTIANARDSIMLHEWVRNGGTGGHSMSVDEALRHLNVDQKLNELEPSVIPTVFAMAREDRPGATTERAITAVEQALANAAGGSNAHSAALWPVGLTSLGNTCYLNSLLQYYYCIKPLRDVVLDYDRYKLDTSKHAAKKERVGGLNIVPEEIQGCQRFAEGLKQLFERMLKDPGRTVKPEELFVCRTFLPITDYKLLDAIADGTATANGTNENAVEDKPEEPTHSDASSNTLQASVNGETAEAPAEEDPDVPPPLEYSPPPEKEGEDSEMTNDKPAPPLPPRRRFSTTTEEVLEIARKNARAQHDVNEVHDQALFRLRCGMNPEGQDPFGEQIDALGTLFSMVLEQTIVKNGEIEGEPKLLQDFHVLLNVPYDLIDVYTALDDIFDLLPYASDADKEVFQSFKQLPPLLQISIPRIGQRGGGMQKITETVRLEDEIYLDRYLNRKDKDILPKRKKYWDMRRQLKTHRLDRKNAAQSPVALKMDNPTAIAQTAKYVSGLDVLNQELQSLGIDPIEGDGDLTAALEAESEQLVKHIAVLDSEIDRLQKTIDNEWADLKEVKYRLAAVFFHRGGYGYGHYWIYIRDFKSGMWRKYNDETVEEYTNLRQILEPTEAEGTATYAVYVSDDHLDLIDPVCRDPEDPPVPEVQIWSETTNDVTMGNTSNAEEPVKTIDPRVLTRQEGGSTSEHWDPPREVANAKWLNGTKPRVHFEDEALSQAVLDEKIAAMLQEYEYSSSPPKSPKKRVSSTDPALMAGGPKLRRVGVLPNPPPNSPNSDAAEDFAELDLGE